MGWPQRSRCAVLCYGRLTVLDANHHRVLADGNSLSISLTYEDKY